jgi:hypothetical protein
MLSPGRQYRLRTATLGVLSEPARVAVTLPTDAVLTVAGPNGTSERMIDVLWDGRVIAIFVIDLQERGEIIHPASSAWSF